MNIREFARKEGWREEKLNKVYDAFIASKNLQAELDAFALTYNPVDSAMEELYCQLVGAAVGNVKLDLAAAQASITSENTNYFYKMAEVIVEINFPDSADEDTVFSYSSMECTQWANLVKAACGEEWYQIALLVNEYGY